MKFRSTTSICTNGFSLVEVLVALVVLTLGILGMAGLQGYSITGSYNAHLRTQATALAQDIIDRMRVNRLQAVSDAYDTSFAAAPDSGSNCFGLSATCSPELLANFDVREWKCNLGRYESDSVCNSFVSQINLPQGDGEITTEPDDARPGQVLVTVTVRWSEVDGAVGDTHQVILTTYL